MSGDMDSRGYAVVKPRKENDRYIFYMISETRFPKEITTPIRSSDIISDKRTTESKASQETVILRSRPLRSVTDTPPCSNKYEESYMIDGFVPIM